MSSTDSYYIAGMAVFVVCGAGYIGYKVKQTDPAEDKVKAVVTAFFLGVAAGAFIKMCVTRTINGTLAGSIVGGGCSLVGASSAAIFMELTKRPPQDSNKSISNENKS